MLADLLPPTVVVVETPVDLDAELFPAEEAAIARAVAKRRREFATVRSCARTALGQLGLAPVALLPGERGAPQWPAGIVGSMTHCDGYRAAAVARTSTIRTVGIDAEPHGPLPDGVIGLVSRPEERDHLATLGPGRYWDRILFSAKESTYKAWYPLTGQWLGFEEASVVIEPAAGTFVVSIHKAVSTIDGLPLDTLSGRWVVHGGLVLTAIAATQPSTSGWCGA